MSAMNPQQELSPAQAFDPYSPATRNDPVTSFANFARTCPVNYYRGRFNFFMVNEPTYVEEVMLRDTTTWTIERGNAPTILPDDLKTPMLRDDSSHLAVRRIIQSAFAPTELVRIQAIVDRIVNELIDHMLALPEPEGDFFELFAMPLPSRLMCVLMGVPESDHMRYKHWADRYYFGIFNDPDFTAERQMEEARDIAESLFALIAARREDLKRRNLEPDLALVGRELPNDFMSRFMCSRIGDEPVPDAVALSLILAVILGGNETTMNLIGNLLWRLLERPELWRRLKDDPELIEQAIDESLRLDPPVLAQFRSARHDVELAGVTIPAGAKAMYNIVAVNQNPDQFENPDEFRLGRPRSVARKHASFGGGVHLCVGAGLARMEVKRAFQTLIARLPNLQLMGKPRRAEGFNVWGPTHLPVRWG